VVTGSMAAEGELLEVPASGAEELVNVNEVAAGEVLQRSWQAPPAHCRFAGHCESSVQALLQTETGSAVSRQLKAAHKPPSESQPVVVSQVRVQDPQTHWKPTPQVESFAQGESQCVLLSVPGS
jgi:hypothetical protein